jgi:hypothetical protein
MELFTLRGVESVAHMQDDSLDNEPMWTYLRVSM